MILETLAKRQVNISTIEDPVEKNIERVNQMQINNAAGLTFEKGLRALLRQDPDIIMLVKHVMEKPLLYLSEQQSLDTWY